MYRIRKSWTDYRSQIGAFNNLNNAINFCNNAGEGYYVFNEDGSIAYPKTITNTPSKINTGKELAEACINVAKNYKTLYITGCFGWPMTNANKTRIKNEQASNRKPPRSTNINNASVDTFGFDCVNLIKALLWGWCGDINAEYGGAKYQSNGVPDINDAMMFDACLEKSSDFNNIEIGELCWTPGHVGVYVGNGLSVECTPIWTNNVQFSACNKPKSGYNLRTWQQHGKLPYISYTGIDDAYMKPSTPISKPANYPTLFKGDMGDEVFRLQNILNLFGFSCGTADGDYGNKTFNAVKLFQSSNGLEADGIAGPNTFKMLDLAMSKFSTVIYPDLTFREPVQSIQNILNALGHNCGIADGQYGQGTINGVKSFQKAMNIKKDGVVGPQVVNCMRIYLDELKK